MLSRNFISPVFPLPAWAYGSPGEFARKSEYLLPQPLSRTGISRMELVICFDLVVSLRMCYYDKQVHVGDALNKIQQ